MLDACARSWDWTLVSQNYFIFYYFIYNRHCCYFPFRRIYHTDILVFGRKNGSTIPTGNKISKETVYKNFKRLLNVADHNEFVVQNRNKTHHLTYRLDVIKSLILTHHLQVLLDQVDHQQTNHQKKF